MSYFPGNMNPNETLMSLLKLLPKSTEKLERYSPSANPINFTLLEYIRDVKRLLEKLEEEHFKYLTREDIDEGSKRKTEKEVFEAKLKVDYMLIPDDYKLDKLVFTLSREIEDENAKAVNSFKNIVEVLTNIEDEARDSDENENVPADSAESLQNTDTEQICERSGNDSDIENTPEQSIEVAENPETEIETEKSSEVELDGSKIDEADDKMDGVESSESKNITHDLNDFEPVDNVHNEKTPMYSMRC